ncbi:2-acylglycerol O-acyltransferase 2-like [Plodia interpunctella]|uniref:2-acylglycerol O-acyltransferase 2-like n=1 Tax=Plodia interpunctella TaxID=58824 RepID=UPI0023676104|nr:2-acylglycerol O-acyltransferase 2-like [Plodia interpunctella]
MTRLNWRNIETVLQTIWVGIWFNLFTYGGVVLGIGLMAKLLLSQYWWLGVLYSIWIYYDDKPRRGGRVWFKHLFFLDWFRSYFPLKLIKTVDLDPTKNYIFASYPHGTFAVAALHTTATNGRNFTKLFPGLSVRMIIHNFFYFVPFYRELMQIFPTIDSSAQSIKYVLDKDRYKGICAVIIIGGAREALESAPGKHRLVFYQRQGFIRVAIQTGASIVPMYSFGETEIFGKTTYDNKLLLRFQHWFLNMFGIMVMRMDGRGPLGRIPLKTPVNVVVGAPLHVKKNPNPSKTNIEEVQAQFKERLIELFEREKSKYLENYESLHLEFI